MPSDSRSNAQWIRHAVLAVSFVSAGLGGAAVQRLATGNIELHLSEDADGVRCNVTASSAGGEWTIQTLAVERVEPEPCDPDWVHCHDGGPCDYGKTCDHCPGCAAGPVP
jgi:hypothetical protein